MGPGPSAVGWSPGEEGEGNWGGEEGRGEGGKLCSSINYPNTKRNGFERKPPKPKFDWCFTILFHSFTKNNKHPRVDMHILVQGFSQKQRTMTSYEKTLISCKNSNPDSKADFPEKYSFLCLEVNIV